MRYSEDEKARKQSFQRAKRNLYSGNKLSVIIFHAKCIKTDTNVHLPPLNRKYIRRDEKNNPMALKFITVLKETTVFRLLKFNAISAVF